MPPKKPQVIVEKTYHSQYIPQITYSKSIDSPKLDKSVEVLISVMGTTEEKTLELFRKVKEEIKYG